MDTEWLDWLRVLAAFAVVTLHVTGNVVALRTQPFSGVWWEGDFIDAGSRWCVPVFIMVSGALLLKPRRPENALTFYRKRLRRLCVPIAFWTAFYLIVRARFGKGLTAAEVEWGLLTGTPYFHLWYLYMIFGLYLFTPFFRTYLAGAARSDVRLLLIILFSISAIRAIWNTWTAGSASGPFFTMFLPFTCYYLYGAYLGDNTPGERPWKGLTVLFIVSIVGSALANYLAARRNPGQLYFQDWLSVGVMLMSIAIFAIFSAWRDRLRPASPVTRGALGLIASASLGIYLVHPFIFNILLRTKLVSAGLPPALGAPLLSILIFILSLLTTLVLSEIPFVSEIVSPRTTFRSLLGSLARTDATPAQRN